MDSTNLVCPLCQHENQFSIGTVEGRPLVCSRCKGTFTIRAGAKSVPPRRPGRGRRRLPSTFTISVSAESVPPASTSRRTKVLVRRVLTALVVVAVGAGAIFWFSDQKPSLAKGSDTEDLLSYSFRSANLFMEVHQPEAYAKVFAAKMPADARANPVNKALLEMDKVDAVLSGLIAAGANILTSVTFQTTRLRACSKT